MPIVVLSLASPPRSVVERLNLVNDANVGVSIGNPVWAQDLLRAGVNECCVIVCLGLTMDPNLDEGGYDGAEMLDADVVLLQRMLQLLGQDTKHVILEFKRAQNMRLLPSLGAESNGTFQMQVQDMIATDSDGQELKTRSRFGKLPSWFRCSGGEEATSDHEFCLDPRFASGQIFTPHVLGAMVACEYRMPGIIEMTHMLMAPHPDVTEAKTKAQSPRSPRPQQESACFLWQIRLKRKHQGLTYGEVFSALLHDPEHPALPLGILRRFEDISYGLGYVWTNPAPDTRMVKSDLVFVLADNLFGKAAYEQGLLPFSGRAPARERQEEPQPSGPPIPQPSGPPIAAV